MVVSCNTSLMHLWSYYENTQFFFLSIKLFFFCNSLLLVILSWPQVSHSKRPSIWNLLLYIKHTTFTNPITKFYSCSHYNLQLTLKMHVKIFALVVYRNSHVMNWIQKIHFKQTSNFITFLERKFEHNFVPSMKELKCLKPCNRPYIKHV